MKTVIAKKIQEMVDLETKGWNTKNPDLFLSIIHPDMAWPWPPTADAHDPIDWVFVLGRFDRERWRKNWQDIFDSHELIRNQRDTVKIEVSNEQDAAFAVGVHDRLIRGAGLQVVVADEPQVQIGDAVVGRRGRCRRRRRDTVTAGSGYEHECRERELRRLGAA